MAAVLSSEDSSYFSSGLRRSQSQNNFAHSSSSYRPADTHLSSAFSQHPKPPCSDSDASSAPSSPPPIQMESTDISFSSTPASNLSISSDFDETLGIDEAPEDHFSLPILGQEKFYYSPAVATQKDDSLEAPPSPKTGDSYSVSPVEPNSSQATSGPDTPEIPEHPADDTAVSSKPSRQVDYLSHDWREEDIWSSWRYIISKRGEFANSARLENASWRTWMKARNNLKTISPEELNWLKDCDVTWLYGPLQCGPKQAHGTNTEPSSVSLSKTDSLVNLNKKPILKKRSMSEIMLQRSLISASLLKQATAAVQAQETRGVLKHKADKSNTDFFVTYPLSKRRGSQEATSPTTLSISTDSSTVSSPYPERKHIHFNEQVEQCIAIDVKDDDEDDLEPDTFAVDSDSDDGGVMMKRVRSKKRGPSSKKRSSKHKSKKKDGKIIAKLPSTTLKYREDTPEPQETAMKHGTGVYRSPLLSPSSSQETLRPTKKSSKFFFGAEDDDDDESSYPFSAGWRSPPPSGSLNRSPSSGSLTDDPAGMRRTASGMLMPYEDGDVPQGDGILGRMIDTVNTARDIAHVIWNVGWRK